LGEKCPPISFEQLADFGNLKNEKVAYFAGVHCHCAGSDLFFHFSAAVSFLFFFLFRLSLLFSPFLFWNLTVDRSVEEEKAEAQNIIDRTKLWIKELENEEGRFGLDKKNFGVRYRPLRPVLGGSFEASIGGKRGGVLTTTFEKPIGGSQFQLRHEHRANGDYFSRARLSQPLAGGQLHFTGETGPDRRELSMSYERRVGPGKLSFDVRHDHHRGGSVMLTFKKTLSGKKKQIHKAFEQVRKHLERRERK
jgi:hypothetical protein